MERLAEQRQDMMGYFTPKDGIDGMDCVQKLAAYEDAGLELEICSEYKKFEDELVASRKTFRHVLDLLAAERDGRLVVLPCKVGDTVYRLAHDCARGIRYNPFDENGCSTAEICLKCDTYPCDLHKAVIPVKAESEDWIWENKDAFGKTVFLALAAAEEKMKGAPDD